MAFGEQWGNFPLLGTPGPVLTMEQNLAQATLPAAGITTNYNLSTMIYFQFVFAAITVIILGGSLLGRINLLAWMAFVPLWITFSYTVGAFRFAFDIGEYFVRSVADVCYSLWGGGFLSQMGVLDYSGGYVIHLSSGTAGEQDIHLFILFE
jgi:Amt family ammonium transporter